MEIKVEKPDQQQLEALGVDSWPTWTKERSTFDWSYDTQEIAYIIEGEVTVTLKDGDKAVSFGVGDLVTFPKGLDCIWDVKKALRKHYKFS